MPTKQFEGKIKAGHVLVAEEGSGFRVQGSGNTSAPSLPDSIPPSSLNSEPRTLNPVGYLIATDQYFKRDDVGIIYQINIAEGKRRGLIGATLLKAQFDRSAYGCRLYCCWCAQDIEANRFWESMGFITLAFSTRSAAKSRVHLLAETDSSRGCDHALLVSGADEQWIDPRGSVGPADSAGETLVGRDAQGSPCSTGFQPVPSGAEEEERHGFETRATTEDHANPRSIAVHCTRRGEGQTQEGTGSEAEERSEAHRGGAGASRSLAGEGERGPVSPGVVREV